MQDDSDPYGWKQESKDLLRGVAAGAIIGIPLLYTMEMWWRGMSASAWHLLLLLVVILLVNITFSFVSGFREEFSVREAISESVTAVGVGLVFSALVLMLIGEITFDTVWSDMVGRVLIETAAVSVGIVFANSQVRKKLPRRLSELPQWPASLCSARRSPWRGRRSVR